MSRQRKTAQVELSQEDAERLVLNYVEKHPRARTSEILLALKIEPNLLIDTLDELENKRILKARRVELAGK